MKIQMESNIMGLMSNLKQLLPNRVRTDIAEALGLNDIHSTVRRVDRNLAAEESRQAHLASYLESLDALVVRNVTTPDDLPLPPLKLIYLVAGTCDVDWFFKGGQAGAACIREVLQQNGLAIENFRQILDFGSGCGRVIRHWKDLTHIKICGSVYNPDLVGWCQANLSFAEFKTNGLQPPLSFDSASFDFIYALSVFTHLPEDVQMPWMQELSRVIVPGGYLLVTTHGDYYMGKLNEDEKRKFAANQLVVQRSDVAGSNDCNAYHPENYVREKLAVGFDVVAFISRGSKGTPYQDLYLLRKSGGTPAFSAPAPG
jgi:SAM-dependent methyltransferase